MCSSGIQTISYFMLANSHEWYSPGQSKEKNRRRIFSNAFYASKIEIDFTGYKKYNAILSLFHRDETETKHIQTKKL